MARTPHILVVDDRRKIRDAVNGSASHSRLTWLFEVPVSPAGELTAVWVPDEGHEAMRDLVRARTAALESLRRARQQLLGFLLRHDRVFRMGCNCTKKHRIWLSGLRFQHPAHQIVLQEYIHAVDDAAARLARIEDQIRTHP